MKKLFFAIIILLILSDCNSVEEKKAEIPLTSGTDTTQTENLNKTNVSQKTENNILPYLVDEKASPDGTKSYRYYSNKAEGCGCQLGNECVLQVTDTKSGAILKDFEPPMVGLCGSFKELGGLPKGWFDSNNLLIGYSNGDMCYRNISYKTYDIVTGATKTIWNLNTPCILGDIITFDDKQYLIEQSDFYLAEKGKQTGNAKIYDITNVKFTQNDHEMGIGDVYELKCEGDEDFNCYKFNPKSKDLSKMKLLQTISVNGSFEIEDDWHGIYFKVDGKSYQFVQEENVIKELAGNTKSDEKL